MKKFWHSGMIEQGESPTVRELQEVRRRLKLKDQALEAL